MPKNTKQKIKYSGVEWIGNVPENWRVQRLKSIVRATKNGAWGDDPKGNSNDIVCVRVADFDKENFGISLNKLTIRNVENHENLLLEKNDLIFEKSGGGDLQLVGRVVLFNQDIKAITSNFLSTIRLKNEIADPNFYYYLLKYYYNSSINYKSIKQTTGIQNIDADAYFQELVPLPNLSTQKIISDYLDTKTEQIKTFIGDKKKLIALLEEQKKTIIYEAVTKGLDKDVKTKPSGVEWLGDIPENWELRKVTRIFERIGSGTTPNTSNKNYYNNGTIRWVNTGDLNDGYLVDCEKRITELAILENPTLRTYHQNSLIIALYGATIGKLGILTFDATVNQACCVMSNTKVAEVKFIYYWFLINKNNLIQMSYGGGQPNISQDIIRSLKIPLPSLLIQKTILDYLDIEIEKIDQAISTVKQEIKLIEEYKKSLIYHAVTGKIESLLTHK